MSTYAYDQLVRAFRMARRRIETREAAPAVSEVQAGVGYVADALAEILADDDPKFDAEAFRKAVGA